MTTTSTVDLSKLRRDIDGVDKRLVSLLNERAAISLSIGDAKRSVTDSSAQDAEQEPHVYIPAREKAIFAKLRSLNHGPIAHDALCAIYREIMSASISLQKQVAIAYLGPPGTYSHQASTERFGDSMLYRPQKTIGDVFETMARGRATYGVVPFENSTSGSVVETLDHFKSLESGINIRAETYLSVHHCLLSNSSLKTIRRVYSHNEAFSQCRRWLSQNLDGIECVRVSSTAKAAELAAAEAFSAAICGSVCAELHGLSIIAEEIEDVKNNTTRFFVLGTSSDKPTGEDKTYVRFTVDHRQPGALADGLRVFKTHDINLTKIDSRPSLLLDNPWHYVFFVEFAGHAEDRNVATALKELGEFCLDVRVLGSYPDQRPNSIPSL